jgi:putative CocE/NonD family hydrolase
MRVLPARAAAVACAALLGGASPPGGPDEPRARFTKHEDRIPMRDGARLFTAVYVPKDDSRRYPILLHRTPYGVGPYGVDRYPERLGPSELVARDGYILAYQDVRGRFLSEGEWTDMRPHLPVKRGPRDVDESTDAHDTVDWLVKQVRNNNGRVGIWGVSYPGFFAAAALPGAHPALVAASPQAPVADLFMGDDSFHNGAFFLAANFGFFANFTDRKGPPAPPRERPRFDYGTPDGYEFFLRLGPLANANARYFKGENGGWNALVEHTTYDAFWRSRAIARHLAGVRAAVLTVGGWFDAEDLAGPLSVYRAIEAMNPGADNRIVMGPWSHGQWQEGDGDRLGNLDFDGKTAGEYRERIERPFLARHLKGAAADPLPEATMFQTGWNEWRRFDAWPPRDAARTTYYLAAEGGLDASPPAEPEAFDEYVSDPMRPVPYLGYTARGMRHDYMTEDQRFAATRPDVLVYQTQPLEEDVSVVGPIEVELMVSTSGTDSDFVVKLIDVYPPDYPDRPRAGGESEPPANAVTRGGYQQLVRGEPFRGRFRRGFETPAPFTPNRPDSIRFAMPDINHTFRQGHRIMVQIQSTWFPFVDRNPQTFVENPFAARREDYRTATMRVYRSVERPTRLEILVHRQ